MSDAENDPVLSRAIEELRRVPAVSPDAVRRVVDAAAIARVTPADEPVDVERSRRIRSTRIWTIAGVAAAAGIIGFVARGAWTPARNSVSEQGAQGAQPAAAMSAQVRPVSDAGAAMPVLQQFVFENPTAHHVAVVGDFNNWNAHSAPMTRSANGSLWSVEIPMLPGRHVFGFMVDDSVFALDPRAPKARDPDLGTDGSVILVGRP